MGRRSWRFPPLHPSTPSPLAAEPQHPAPDPSADDIGHPHDHPQDDPHLDPPAADDAPALPLDPAAADDAYPAAADDAPAMPLDPDAADVPPPMPLPHNPHQYHAMDLPPTGPMPPLNETLEAFLLAFRPVEPTTTLQVALQLILNRGTSLRIGLSQLVKLQRIHGLSADVLEQGATCLAKLVRGRVISAASEIPLCNGYRLCAPVQGLQEVMEAYATLSHSLPVHGGTWRVVRIHIDGKSMRLSRSENAFTPVSMGFADGHPSFQGRYDAMTTLFSIIAADDPLPADSLPPTVAMLAANNARVVQLAVNLAIRLAQQALPELELRFIVLGDRPEMARASGVGRGCLHCGMKRTEFTQHYLYGPLTFLLPRQVAILTTNSYAYDPMHDDDAVNRDVYWLTFVRQPSIDRPPHGRGTDTPSVTPPRPPRRHTPMTRPPICTSRVGKPERRGPQRQCITAVITPPRATTICIPMNKLRGVRYPSPASSPSCTTSHALCASHRVAHCRSSWPCDLSRYGPPSR